MALVALLGTLAVLAALDGVVLPAVALGAAVVLIAAVVARDCAIALGSVLTAISEGTAAVEDGDHGMRREVVVPFGGTGRSDVPTRGGGDGGARAAEADAVPAARRVAS